MKKIFSAFVVVALFVAPTLAFADVGITLNGANPQTVFQNQPYVDPGFNAFSTVNGNVTASVVTSDVNTLAAGNTSRIYSITDVDNTDPLNPVTSTAETTRDIIVQSIGGSLLYCSSQMAPGYTVGQPHGGANCPQSTPTWVPFNGVSCAFMQGCMIKE